MYGSMNTQYFTPSEALLQNVLYAAALPAMDWNFILSTTELLFLPHRPKTLPWLWDWAVPRLSAFSAFFHFLLSWIILTEVCCHPAVIPLYVCNMYVPLDTSIFWFFFFPLEEAINSSEEFDDYIPIYSFLFLICVLYWPSWLSDFMVLCTILGFLAIISLYFLSVPPHSTPPGNHVSHSLVEFHDSLLTMASLFSAIFFFYASFVLLRYWVINISLNM